MNKRQQADEYIQKNKHKVTARPHFHFSPEIGWMNDPNGFVYYGGEYHLFYQYNPYDIVWNNIHWGHATTRDFINWNYCPVAMANDKVYDANGCFSGSAIEKDGKLYLMYTGHIDPNLGFDKDESQIIQQQCIAISEDGIHFEKYAGNPVIGKNDLPEGYLVCDFRDPKVFEMNGTYYCVLAVRNAERRGEILMFSSKDLLEWSFHAAIYRAKSEDNILFECPDLFRIGNKDVLLFSVMPCDPEYQSQVLHKTVYVVGEMDYERGTFKPEHKGLLDCGYSFYAPQSTEGADGERLLIGWMHHWNQKSPPKEYGFSGMMSLPRVLSLKNNKLMQEPLPAIKGIFQDTKHYLNVTLQAGEKLCIDGEEKGYLSVTVSGSESNFTLELQKNEAKSTRLHVDKANATITFESDYGDQERRVIPDFIAQPAGDLTLEVFIDLHSIEIFINSGENVISYCTYERDKGKDISIQANGKLELKKVIYRT